MTRIEWNENVPRVDGGCDHGVLYLDVGAVPWNGLVKVTESDDVEIKKHFFDGKLVRVTENLGSFTAELEAFYYPDEFESYSGFDLYLTHQPRRPFGLAYRTGLDDDQQIHLVWNALARPNIKANATRSSVGTLTTFSWSLEAKSSGRPGFPPIAHMVIDLRGVQDTGAWAGLEELLFGSAAVTPSLPSAQEVAEYFEEYVTVRIVDNLDGTWTASGPGVTDQGDGTYEISSPSAGELGEYTHQVSSD